MSSEDEEEHRVPFDEPSIYETRFPSEEDRELDDADREMMQDEGESGGFHARDDLPSSLGEPVYENAEHSLAEHIAWKVGQKVDHNMRDCAFEADLRLTKATLPKGNTFPATTKQLVALMGKRRVNDLMRHQCIHCGVVFPVLERHREVEHYADKCDACETGSRFTYCGLQITSCNHLLFLTDGTKHGGRFLDQRRTTPPAA